MKSAIKSILDSLPSLTLKKELSGSNESRQYNAEITYKSCLANREDRILIDIGLRENLNKPIFSGRIRTLLINPFLEKPLISSFNFPCLDILEAYSEKMRAALCREKLAIRDFYDLDYAIKSNILDINKSEFIELVKAKLAIPDTEITKFNNVHINFLKNRVHSELLPTLKYIQDFQFDVQAVIEMLLKFSREHLITVKSKESSSEKA